MYKEQNFAKLLRQSKFASYDPSIPRVYIASSPSPTSRSSTRSDHPAFFGFKKDLHPTHYGRPLCHVQMKKLDGKYGLCELRNGEDRARSYQTLQELQRLIGGKVSQDGESCLYADFSQRPYNSSKDATRIPGRVLNNLPGNKGYAIGIAGIVAELPNSEIPPLQHFTREDIRLRRAFYFYIMKAELDRFGRPCVLVSLRAPQ